MEISAKVQVHGSRLSHSGEWRFVKMLADFGDETGAEAVEHVQGVKDPVPSDGIYNAVFRVDVRYKRAQLRMVKLTPAQAMPKAA